MRTVIVRIYANEETISGNFRLVREEDPRCDILYDIGNATIIMHGAFKGMKFCVKTDLKIREGKITAVGKNMLRVENAKEY